MNIKFFAYIGLLGASTGIFAEPRHYITGNGFCAYADYVIDENSQYLDPVSIKPKSTIFLKTDYLNYFFTQLFPRIKVPIILISHNSDYPAPGAYYRYLDDPKILAWFGQNCDRLHPKFHPIPIGIANPKWPHGNKAIFDKVLNTLNYELGNRRMAAYINFSPHTNKIRTVVYNHFKGKKIAAYASVKPLEQYLHEMATFQFVISPFGNGLDCHRTWESLLVGSLPIVTKSTLDQLYEDLPVIIVDKWEDVTEEFFSKKLEEMKSKTYRWEKLFLDFWLAQIEEVKHGAQ